MPKNTFPNHLTTAYTVVRLVDIENLSGGSQRVEEKNPWVMHELRRHTIVGAREMTTIAVGVSVIRRAPQLLWSWRGMRTLIGSGLNGADNKLSEVLAFEPVSQTAERIEIWSGDHHFSELAELMRLRGAEVHVFARPSSIARSLAQAATEVHPLFDTPASMRCTMAEPIGATTPQLLPAA